MAPRRCVRSVKVINNNNYTNLSLNDVLCPICRCIFIEPVTLPCSHGFCLPCFEGTLANANLTCPMCRVRFGSWHRVAKKERKIINIQFWDAIKVAFPKEVTNRLNGIDEQLEEPAPIRITTPGSIRREYELQKSKEELELAKQREKELKASEELINKLKKEEERDKADMEKKIKLDEHVAKQIAKEIDYGANNKTSVMVAKKPMDKFVNKKQCMFVYKIQNNNKTKQIVCPDINSLLKTTNNNAKNQVIATVCDKGDCMNRNLTYFKPIDQIHVPLKKIVSPIKVPAKTNKVSTVIIRPPNGKTAFAHDSFISAFASFMNSTEIKSTNKEQIRKRKVTDCSNEEECKITQGYNFYLPSKRPAIHDTRQNNVRLHCDIKTPSTSPPFFGFDNSTIKTVPSSNVKTTNDKPNLITAKQLQEERDLEFARQLQEEMNRNSRYRTRNSISQRYALRKRQITLDEFIKSPKPAVI